MFDRYNIIDEADLASAMAKLSNGTVAGTVRGFTRGFGSGKFKPCITRRRSQVVRQRSAKGLCLFPS